MTQRRQDTKFHHCTLPQEPDDVVSCFIESGMFVLYRRSIKRLTMINFKHPMTRQYVTSWRALRAEQRKHLIKYYHMIHPYSLWNFWFSIVISSIICFYCLVWPTASTFVSLDKKFYMFAIPNLIFFTIIPISFVTGYHDNTKHKVILKPRSIALRYLYTNFLFDVVSMAPFIYKFMLLLDFIPRFEATHTLTKFVEYIIPLCKFSRVGYMLTTMNHIRIYFHFNHYTYKAIKLCVGLIFCVQIINTGLFAAVELHPNINRTYIDCMRSTFGTLMMVNHGFKISTLMFDRIYPIVLISMGFILHLILLSNVRQLWHHFVSTETKQRSIFDSIEAFMRQKALPQEMKERIKLYLDFKYQRHFYKESLIGRLTTDFLKSEISLTICNRHFDSVEFLQKLPESIRQEIRTNVFQEIFLPDDIIIKAGTTGLCMFFLLAGTVRVTTPDDKHICYLRDGSYFGEISLIAHVPRVANVIAVSPIEVLKLYRKQFSMILEQFPDLMMEISNIAMKRATETQVLELRGIKIDMDPFRDSTGEDPELMLPGEDQSINEFV